MKDRGSPGEQVVLQQQAESEQRFPPGLSKRPLLNVHKLSPKTQRGHFVFGTQSPDSAGLSTSLQRS